MQYSWTAICFVIFLSIYKKGTSGLQYSAVMLADKGYRLDDSVIQSTIVRSSIECAQHCLIDQRCESLNYQSTPVNSRSVICELNNSTKSKKRDKLLKDPRFSYYDLQKQIPETTDGCNTSEGLDVCTKNPCDNNGTCSIVDAGFYCTCATGFQGAHCEQEAVSTNCSQLKTNQRITIDGEYKLYLQYPSCNVTVDVYCADMDSTMPKEYITLKAGDTNNFSKKNYVGSVKQNLWSSTKTNFAKIRINPADLSVIRNDYRFATIVWFYTKETFCQYASGADCSAGSCDSTKKGTFKMDLTDTGFKFSAPIFWKYSGYPNCQATQPVGYAIDKNKQIVSGNCGGYCGDCHAKTLKLEVEGC